MSTSSTTMISTAFVIYREGNELQLVARGKEEQNHNDDDDDDVCKTLHQTPVIRICALDGQRLLLLNSNQQLLLGSCHPDNERMQLKLLREHVSDVDFCRGTRTLYLVHADGLVFAQEINSSEVGTKCWQIVTFDPLELLEEGIRVARVKCSMYGVLFVTTNNEIYALGSCGDIFQMEAQPLQLRLFEKPKEVVDLVAGDEHFVLLLRDEQSNEPEESSDHPFSPLLTSRRTATSGRHLRRSSQNVTGMLTTPSEPEAAKTHKRQPSAASANSLSSQASQSQYSGEDSVEDSLQQLLRQGYKLLQTQVYTFAAANGGLLGTGDHIKRPHVSCIQKLRGVGACAIAAGREHSIARTLDGRLLHWGLNSKQQLNGSQECSDLSAPQELSLDGDDISDMERTILSACCGDYKTLLLNIEGKLYARDVQLKRELLNWQGSSDSSQSAVAPFMLSAGCFTLHNRGALRKNFAEPLNSLQMQLRTLLQQRALVEAVLAFQRKSSCPTIRQLVLISQCFFKMLYYAAAVVHDVELYYRGVLNNATELIFIRNSKPSIALLEVYTRLYCDARSINGFVEAAKVYSRFLNLPAPASKGATAETIDLERLFQQPFKMLPTIIRSLELLSKISPEFAEHMLAWQSFSQQQRIDLELADHTQEFWLRNERSVKLRHFRSKTRRVILSSERVPLRVGNSALTLVPGAHPIFVLFSDCLCQVSTNVQTFPLVAMWLKHGSDKSLQVTTPEKSFTLIARSHLDKMLWYDQLESAIAAALGTPGAKMSNSRRMAYVYSAKHARYANVDAYGQWRNGVLHGNCYLQFPDDKCYLGEARNGEIEGYGKMVIPSVGVYEGYFKSGKFHGYGCFEMKDNEVYTGHFRDGLFHGHGILRNNSFSYVGEFQANLKCGYGVQDDAVSGEKYIGMFADNKRSGAGICITMSGDYFEGIFVNDELMGQGIAVFENDYFYEGELTLSGPNGKGVYYMPHGSTENENSNLDYDSTHSKQQMIGNILSGQLAGSWNDVRILSGTIVTSRKFSRYPKSIGDLVVDNSRKWRSLFDDFEQEVLGGTNYASCSTKELWNRISIYSTTLRERDKVRLQQDSAYQSYVQSNFAKNISMGFSASMDKISLKSANSWLTCAHSSISGSSDDVQRLARRSYSQETLFEFDLNDLDFMNSTTFPNHEEQHSFHNLLNTQLGNWANDSSSSLHSSFDSVLNLSSNSKNNSSSTQNGLDFAPNFGLTSLNAEDIASIKEYLVQAFKDPHHPLYLLNQRIANSFYTSYGCWKMKPTPILAKQAMREWESISKRVYRFVRRMFPALPEDYCVVESTREVVSHITLLYPIVLSEGIYSTLFVLYANKYSDKDEMYRQNLLFAEKLKDAELSEYLGLDKMLLPVVSNEYFYTAIQTLKQVQEKYSPKAMLIVIEKCMQLITEAHKLAENENTTILAADSMMPLTLFLVLRAAVPHLGAELALLDDLTGGSNFQIEMNGFAGYCYTTLKASYEHLTSALLKKT